MADTIYRSTYLEYQHDKPEASHKSDRDPSKDIADSGTLAVISEDTGLIGAGGVCCKEILHTIIGCGRVSGGRDDDPCRRHREDVGDNCSIYLDEALE